MVCKKVFYTFGQLGSVFAEGAGKNDFRYSPAGVVDDGLPCLVALVTREKMLPVNVEIHAFKKALLIKTQPA